MSIFGKVLLFFNAAMVGLLLFVAALDLAKREQWADNYLQHQLIIEGLPLDAEERDLQNEPKVDHIRQPLLNKVFAGGSPVKTQMEEVSRVKQAIQASVDQQATSKDKAKRLVRVLRPLCDTLAEREALAAVDQAAEIKDEDVAKLQKQLDDKFAAAESVPDAKDPAQRQPLTIDQKKLAAAELVFRLTDVFREAEDPQKPLTESKPYERFLTVFGVTTAARAVEHNAATLTQIAADSRDALDRERQVFAADYRGRLANIEALSEKLASLQSVLKDQKDLVAAKDTVVKDRRDEVEKLKADLKKAQEEVEALVARQKFIEDGLYKSRQDLRDAFAANQSLEQLLQSHEKGR